LDPVPMSSRGVPKPVSPQVLEYVPPVSDKLEEQDSLEEQAPPPPLEELEPPLVPPIRTSPKITPQPQVPGRKGQVVNKEPSVGSDRYEDIIVETRKRSLSRTGSRMGSRTSSVLDFRASQTDFKTSNASIGKLDLDSIRSSTRSSAVQDLDINNVGSKLLSPKPLTPPKPLSPPKQPTPEIPKKPSTPEVPKIPAPETPKVEVKAPLSKRPPMVALDANQNATLPSLPVVPPSPPIKPSEPDMLVKFFPKNIPHWFVITYTYSVVLIMILLIANVSPDGKLFIHFTAFWSLILYFGLEDDKATDLLDTVVEGFLKK